MFHDHYGEGDGSPSAREIQWRREHAKKQREKKKDECKRAINHNFDSANFADMNIDKLSLLSFAGLLQREVHDLKLLIYDLPIVFTTLQLFSKMFAL